MSALCGSDNGMTFNELKSECNLTDGNLNRHLKTLEEAKAVRLRKKSSGGRPTTVVRISDVGRERFIDYLATLEAIEANDVNDVIDIVVMMDAYNRMTTFQDGLYHLTGDVFANDLVARRAMKPVARQTTLTFTLPGSATDSS